MHPEWGCTGGSNALRTPSRVPGAGLGEEFVPEGAPVPTSPTRGGTRLPPGAPSPAGLLRPGAPGPRRPAHLPCPRPARPPEAPHVAVLVGEVAARLAAAVLEVGEAAAVDERGALAAPRAREGLHEAPIEAVVARAHPAALAHGGRCRAPAVCLPVQRLLSALLSARPLAPSCRRVSGPAICRSVPCSVPTLLYLPPCPPSPAQPSRLTARRLSGWAKWSAGRAHCLGSCAWQGVGGEQGMGFDFPGAGGSDGVL